MLQPIDQIPEMHRGRGRFTGVAARANLAFGRTVSSVGTPGEITSRQLGRLVAHDARSSARRKNLDRIFPRSYLP